MENIFRPGSGGVPMGGSLPPASARAGRGIKIALRAIIFVVAVYGAAACSNPVLAPEAEVCIVSARGLNTGAESSLAISMRVSVKGGLSLERFGITVRAASDRRSYWHTDIVTEEVPAGASVILETVMAFDSADETYVEGSAVIESAWFE